MNRSPGYFFKYSRLAFAGMLISAAQLGYAQAPQVLTYDGGHDDHGYAVATDASGALFVGGYSNVDSSPATFAVLKYNPAGTLQWLARPQGLANYTAISVSDLATDPAGNVYAVGYASRPLPFLQNDLGWLVTSFDAQGVQRWAQLFNGADNSFDVARRVAIDPQQGIYVMGTTTGAFGRADWLTIKYSFAGVEQWRRIESGAGNTDDQPIAINVDGAGNVVVVGYVEVSQGGPKDVRVVKFDSNGNIRWRADYSDTATSDEAPNAAAIDGNGNIYVTADRGLSTNPELGSTPITIKFDANGNRLFVLQGAGRGGSAIAIDPAGNFIVSGISVDEVGSNVIRMTAKFTPNGALLWSLPFETSHLGIDDITGNIYLTRGSSYTAVKVSSAGQLLWEQTIPNGRTVNEGIVDDATGNFIVTGNSDLGNGNILTARFSANNVPPPPPPLPVPAAPTGLSASAKKGALSLSWSDKANNETGFRIESSIDGGAFAQVAQVGANVKTFDHAGLIKGRTYTYRVRAYNTNGNSAYSNTASGVPR